VSETLVTWTAAAIYLASVVIAYRWGIGNVNRFRWHSHKHYHCYGAPCSDCRFLMALCALTWPLASLFLLVPAAPDHGRLMRADEAAKDALTDGRSKDEAWRIGVQVYEGRLVEFVPMPWLR
jgi:hypothetical protein